MGRGRAWQRPQAFIPALPMWQGKFSLSCRDKL